MSSNKNATQKKIIVLGDVMLDINYFSSTPDRTAPESSSVGVHKVNHVTHTLGGAANVAAGFAALGCNVYLFGIIGYDLHGDLLEKMILGKIHNHLTRDGARPTTQKHRKFVNNVLTTRFDIEDTTEPAEPYTHFCGEILRLISEEDIYAIVFSDYDKGYLTEDLCRTVILSANARGIYTFIDPKINNPKKYRNCFCFKPNSNEARELTKIPAVPSGNVGGGAAADVSSDDLHIKSCGEPVSEIEIIMASLFKLVQCNHILLTDGANGIFAAAREGGSHIHHIKHTEAIDVRDVTGAGDVVMVAFVYTFLWKYDILLAARVANIVGGKSVKVLGNYKLTRDVLEEIVHEVSSADRAEKNAAAAAPQAAETLQTTIKKAADIRTRANEMGKTVVFTNGCFDILHSAHLRLLNYCKSRGDILVVGLNSDESVRRLKGTERPINDVLERLSALHELRGAVDYVIVFEEDTPLSLIEELRPDVLVKGGDYTPETVVGAEYAGAVEIFGYIEGKSTTNVVSKVAAAASAAAEAGRG